MNIFNFSKTDILEQNKTLLEIVEIQDERNKILTEIINIKEEVINFKEERIRAQEERIKVLLSQLVKT
jgi:hypothetical protein